MPAARARRDRREGTPRRFVAAVDYDVASEPSFRVCPPTLASVVTQPEPLRHRSQPFTFEPGLADQVRLGNCEDSGVNRVSEQVGWPACLADVAG
jgi:hypothetical protein